MMAGVPLGRLPGDIIIGAATTTFYLPIVTCLVISIVLSLILSIFAADGTCRA